MHAPRTIAIFFTGGTIGMQQSADGAVRPALHLADLLAELLGAATKNAPLGPEHILPVEWADLPSPHMTPALMFQLAMDVKSMLEREDVAGAVVTHGTDVMEETAFLLDLVVPSPKPIVVTGAMRSHDEAGYDGLRNLAAAIRLCLYPVPPDLGTVVLMADKMYAAREVTKVHSLAVNAFDAPGAGPLGTCVAGGVQLFRTPLPRKALTPEAIETAVDVVSLAPGMDGRFLACARQCGAQGIVVEGFGAGNVPPGVLEEIRAAVAAHIPVVLTSRCIEGGVWPLYGYKGGANELRDLGVILGGSLRAPKARILLMAALGMARGLSGAAKMEGVRAAFQAY